MFEHYWKEHEEGMTFDPSTERVPLNLLYPIDQRSLAKKCIYSLYCCLGEKNQKSFLELSFEKNNNKKTKKKTSVFINDILSHSIKS